MGVRGWLLVLVLISSAAGCGSRRIAIPSLDPSAMTSRALTDYDTNRDGFLDAKELERCPGLKSALPGIDKNKDGRLSREELLAYFTSLAEIRAGLQRTTCRVLLDGEPLSGATVTAEPEAFMGGAAKPAQGVTDNTGQAELTVEGGVLPGCNLGIYRLRISKTDPQGQETLPPQYNKQTQLGLEVSQNVRGQPVFNLRSR
jgi:hypothetical protein